MKVGYVVLYEDGELVISKNHTLLQKKIIKDYGEFDDTDVPWIDKSSQIKKVQILDQVKSNYMKEWFEDCINLNILINFKNLDTSDCINFSFIFSNCISLQDINDLQTWNVSKGTDFLGMFKYCIFLQEILLSNTLNILTKEMFELCNPTLKIHWKKHIYTYADLLEYQKIY